MAPQNAPPALLDRLVELFATHAGGPGLSALLDQLPAAVAIVEAPSGKTIVANAANAELFRFQNAASREGVERYGVYAGYRPDGTKVAPREWPLARSITTGEVVRGEEIEVERGDGTRAFIRINSAPLRDKDGKIVAGVVVYDDISARRRSELGMRYVSEASRILASSLDYEATLAAITRIAVPELADWCSVELFGADGEPVQVALAHVDADKVELAREYRRRFPPNMSGDAGLARLKRTGEHEVIPDIPDDLLASLVKDPVQLDMLRRIGIRSGVTAPLSIGGEVLGALSLVSSGSHRFDEVDALVVREVASRAALAIQNARLYAEAQEAVRLRDEFLSVASHELRTPLQTLSLRIGALVRAQARDPSAPADRAKLGGASAAVDRMLQLVENLLDRSRIESGLSIKRSDVDAAELAQAVVERFASETVAVAAAGDTRGSWDAERLEQVLTNLVSNALKYGEGKPVHVRVDGAAADLVCITVADGGVGIEPDDIPRLFQKLVRGATARPFKGLGLGLWIARAAVEAHGGTIDVSSCLGQGSTFTVQLPRKATS